MLPELFCEKMKKLLGGEYEAFLAALDRPQAVGLRLNPLKLPQRGTAVSELLPAEYQLTPVLWEPNGFYYASQARPGLYPLHAAGAYYLQEPSAMAPVALLDPQPGEWVLDLCAAPGGKSTQIAGRMGGEGLLVCNEIHPKRAAILASNVERLGISNALVLNEHPSRIAQRFESCFDRVLVDAPCSGEGMFRKHDAAFADWSLETVEMCARRQGEILDWAARTLRPGGRLVYSTCTFSPEENEGSVAAFLARHPEFELEQPLAPWFAPGRPDWADGNSALALCCRLWPHKLLGEGHFAAVLRRSGGGKALSLPREPDAAMPRPVSELLQSLGLRLPAGKPIQFGARVFLGPQELPLLQGLKVLRPGLELAELCRDRAVPAHALALWAREAAACLDLQADSELCEQYLSGGILPTETTGWTLVRVNGLALGWGKGVKGSLKNHYPKGLRILR